MFKFAVWFFLLCLNWGLAQATNKPQSNEAPACEQSNAAFAQMPEVVIEFVRADKTVQRFSAKFANTEQTRMAGFQFICQQTIENTILLFRLEREQKAWFHMRNVLAPLDIAFIRQDGSIDSILLMQTYRQGKQPLYGSVGNVLYAVEAHKGFFKQQGINQDAVFKLLLSNGQ